MEYTFTSKKQRKRCIKCKVMKTQSDFPPIDWDRPEGSRNFQKLPRTRTCAKCLHLKDENVKISLDNASYGSRKTTT